MVVAALEIESKGPQFAGDRLKGGAWNGNIGRAEGAPWKGPQGQALPDCHQCCRSSKPFWRGSRD